MVMPIKPTLPNFENCSATELDVAAKASPSKDGHDRLMAIRALALGIEHDQVAALFMVTRRALLDWITRFNDQGIDGLIDRPRSGRPAAIPADQTENLRTLIEHPEQADRSHWTGKTFHGHLRDELDIEVGYRTVVRWLHDQDFRLKVPQPWPDRQDEEARNAFIQRLKTWLENENIELWYCDETGIEGDPRPRRRWTAKGKTGRVTKNGGHLRMNVCGMICPRTGSFYGLEFSHTDTDTFQAFLDHANRDVNLSRPRNFLICDNASWHKPKSLRWGRFEPIYLPAYSPDMNPIERLWLILKANWFTDFVAKTRDELIGRLDKALCWLIHREDDNQKTCRIKKTL